MKFLSKLGPGILLAGASIGVSHLVQSTRAGADFGLGLLWAFVLINLFKYPFFQFSTRYVAATGKHLITGYNELGRKYIWIYFFINLATMFTIQTAVTIVTAGIAAELFQVNIPIEIICAIITLICLLILFLGKYKALDFLMKGIITILSISTIVALFFAFKNSENTTLSFAQVLPIEKSGLLFLIAFMGWMPAPLDISIWHSIWSVEQNKSYKPTLKESLYDFNIGYITTVILGLAFIFLGFLVMHHSGTTFANGGAAFAKQFIELYTTNLGDKMHLVVAIAALTTMFSTTITTLDGSSRVMIELTTILFKPKKNNYFLWLTVLSLGTCVIFFFLLSEMSLLVQIATVVSFFIAPFFAILNYILVTKKIPKKYQPSAVIKSIAIAGILFLIVFTFTYFLTFVF